jgi:2-dehydrotetronate isomerase
MTKFSANLGFLWPELALPDSIRAAKRAGFDAVECYWPSNVPPEAVNDALAETGFIMLGLNAPRGDVAGGENGMAALPGREADAREAIDRAVGYAAATNTPSVHVMGGFAAGRAAHEAFIGNLRYASSAARGQGITILIEPLNRYDAPGYFLNTSTQAAAVIEELGVDNVKLMFDCYHLQIMEGDISRRLAAMLPLIGHIQFAGVPDRGDPARGELDYRHVFDVIASLGYDAPLGAEYKPDGATADSLGWMTTLR